MGISILESVKFNVPTLVGREMEYISEAINSGQVSGNGAFSKRCATLISESVGHGKVLLTHSCTAALEMAAILAGVEAGDEVIMPSYTFTSTANAFVLRGAVPVFIDVREDTLNLNETLIEQAITEKTKAICVVHYAGVACDMDAVQAIAEKHKLVVIEDAAQAYHASWKGRPLGGGGQFAALSFHETKNIISGEGGALIVNDRDAWERAEIVWEKGTNRASFFRGEVAKYNWVDVGSSFLPNEITAAFLCAQLEQSVAITERRLAAWHCYHQGFVPLERSGLLRRQIVPDGAQANGHIYFVLVREGVDRDAVLRMLNEKGVNATSHYVPLHSAPAGVRFGRVGSEMRVTDDVSARLIRLPIHPQISTEQQDVAIEALAEVLQLHGSVR